MIMATLLATAAVAAIATGTLASFSDQEVSLGNDIRAAIMDLEVDLEVGGENIASAHPLIDLPQDGSSLILSAGEVVPGQFAEATVSLHLKGNPAQDVPGMVFLRMSKSADEDNSCTEPEAEQEGAGCPAVTPDGGQGELDNLSTMLIWYDYGRDNVAGQIDADNSEGDNIRQIEEPVVYDGSAADVAPLGLVVERFLDAAPGVLVDPDGDGVFEDIQDPFIPSTTYHIGIRWDFPLGGTPDNIAQSDSFSIDYVFEARQLLGP